MRISDWSSDVCSSDLVRDALGMARGVGDRGAGALADAEEDEGLAQAGGVDHRLQVADPRFQRKFANLPTAQAAAALVAAHVAVVPGGKETPVAPEPTDGVMVAVGLSVCRTTQHPATPPRYPRP